MTLEQLMAFTVTTDHARQEQVWEALQQSYNKEPYLIRRQLTESAVRATDRRARFVGLESYEAAGGAVLRDLFEDDGGGWLQDVALLDRLATEKLAAEAQNVATEGWKWIEVAVDFRYGHANHLRRLRWRARRAVRGGTGDFRCPDRRIRQAGERLRRTPMSCRTMSMLGLARSRPRSRRSTIVRFATILPRSRAPACLSASMRMERSLSIEAMSGRRTSRLLTTRRRRSIV